MRILTTGSTGFFGSILTKELGYKGYQIIDFQQEAQQKIDLSEPFRLNIGADIVVHAAGKVHVTPKTDEERQEFYTVNYEGTKNLCRALEELDVLPKSFIFISTVAVYGIDEGEGITEDHPLNGQTPYADSKILAELWLEEWAKEHNVILGVLRLPLIAGPNPPGNLGAMINAIKSGKYLSIGKANARKSVVWAEDIALIIPTLAEKGGIYNLTDGYHPTFGELEESISKALRKRKPFKVPYWTAKGLALAGNMLGERFPINSDKLRKITSTLTFDDSKARKELGWNPTPVLEKIHDIVL